jgi:hypothetical protein
MRTRCSVTPSFASHSAARLQGDLPADIASQPALLLAWLNGNQLSGSLAAFAAALPAPTAKSASMLGDLRASGNGLTGALPPELGDRLGVWVRPGLQTSEGLQPNVLDLSGNKLQGAVPDSWYESKVPTRVVVRSFHVVGHDADPCGG